MIWFSAGQIAGPIQKLTRPSLARGSLTQMDATKRDDEIGQLSGRFLT
jgi:hypothetical protein